MRFFLDHDVPTGVARVLRRDGHHVTELRDVLPVIATDLDALRFAFEHELFVITCNRDHFLGLFANQPNPGLIILIRRRSRLAECGNLLRLLHNAGEAGIRANVNLA